MEKILENAKINRTGTMNTKSHIFLTYAYDIDIVGRAEGDVTDAISKIKRQSAKIGLVLSEENTKIMLATARKTLRRKKANRCYFGLAKQLNNRAISPKTKVTQVFKGAEAWVLSRVFERKILRKIYGAFCVDGKLGIE